MGKYEYEKIMQETGLWMMCAFILLVLLHLFTFPAYYYKNNLKKQPTRKKCFNFAGFGYSPTTG